jgi:hypothetical protein
MSNKTKQTAVDWLYNQRIERPLADWDYLLQQAKEIEKEQIIDALLFGDVLSPNTAETYYKETYGGGIK